MEVRFIFLFFLLLNMVDLRPSQKYIGLGVHKAKGEDRYQSIEMNGGHWFGVYDGHSGYFVAEYLENNFHTMFQNTKKLQNDSYEDRFSSVFSEADYACESSSSKEYWCGSTACVVYVEGDYVHVAHVGDSRAVLMNDKRDVVYETRDHKPTVLSEKQRIEDAGGIIVNGRASSSYGRSGLTTSRAIGDWNIDPQKKVFISKPEYKKIFSKDVRYVIMASDGLWDVIKNEDVKKIMENKENKNNPMIIAGKLVEYALEKCKEDEITADDITALVVDLKKLEKNNIKFENKKIVKKYLIIGSIIFVVVFVSGILLYKFAR